MSWNKDELHLKARKKHEEGLESRMANTRLVMFALNLGMSFAILVLYIAYLEVIAIVVLLLTASIVAASREDLTELKKKKSLIILILLFSVVVFFFAAYFFVPYSLNLFYGLIIANFGLLMGYVVMRLLSRRDDNAMFMR